MTNMFEDQSLDQEMQAIKEKYKDNPDEMLKALVHSQKHIAKIEGEAREKDQKLANSMTLEQAVAKIKESNVTPPNNPTDKSGTNSVLDDDTLNQKVEEVLNRKTEAQRQAEAKSLVQSTMLSKFGTVEKATAEMARKAQELDMTPAEFDAMALKSPKAFLQFFGINNTQRQSNTSPNKSTINTEARIMNTPPNTGNALNKYTSMLREPGGYNKYMSPGTQMQIMKEALENPEAFGINTQ